MRRLPVLALVFILPLPALADTGTIPGPITARVVSVYDSDMITAIAEVTSVHPKKPVTQLRVEITRQTGETVLEGEAWCYAMIPGGGLTSNPP